MGAAKSLAQRAAIVVLSIFVAFVAEAQEPDGTRVALIIGNSDYEAVGRLPNPVNDAEAIGAAFTRLGFDVTLITDVDYGAMRRALQDFETKVATAEVAVVFFAGHGIEIDGTNYLIPTDAQLKRDTHVFDETIPLDRVLTAVEQATVLRIIILDACRNNPFVVQMERSGPTRSIGRGLARVDPSGSTILAYAAREGTVADDGDGDHSPFTEALLAHLETPGLEVSFVFRNVRDDVLTATGGIQEPIVYSSLGREEIYFVSTKIPLSPVPVIQVQGAAETDQSNVVVAYQAALAIDTVEAWQAFLRYYSTGLYADLARAALNKLRGEERADVELLPAPEIADQPMFVGDDVDAAVGAAAACDRFAAYQNDPDRPDQIVAVSDAELEANAPAALDACRLAVQHNSGDRRMLSQLARAAGLANRPEEAYEAALEAAELGSAQSIATIGLAYQLGLVVEQSYETAAEWYRRAAEAGGSDGMLHLGYLYDQGLGVPLDLDESGRWFARAAEADNAAAITAIAYRLQNGRGVAQDQVEARYWYERAALRGDGFAMQALGLLHEYGEGGPVDYELARSWYLRAAEQGSGVAMASLGFGYETGLGVAVDLDVARDRYERGAAEGDHVAMFALGRIYEGGIGVEQNYEESVHWYSQSAFTGEMPFALVRLGLFFDQGLGVEQNFATARSLWGEAAAAGEADALVNLGYLFELGRGVPEDLDRAGRYYIEALMAGSQYALEEFVNYSQDYAVAVRRMIEAFLIEQGLLTGKPDGRFDDAARQALQRLGQN